MFFGCPHVAFPQYYDPTPRLTVDNPYYTQQPPQMPSLAWAHGHLSGPFIANSHSTPSVSSQVGAGRCESGALPPPLLLPTSRLSKAQPNRPLPPLAFQTTYWSLQMMIRTQPHSLTDCRTEAAMGSAMDVDQLLPRAAEFDKAPATFNNQVSRLSTPAAPIIHLPCL